MCSQLAALQFLPYAIRNNRTPLNQSAFINFAWYMIIYYQVPSFKIQTDILQVLKVSDEHLGETNTEKRVKYQPVFQKNAPDNFYLSSNIFVRNTMRTTVESFSLDHLNQPGLFCKNRPFTRADRSCNRLLSTLKFHKPIFKFFSRFATLIFEEYLKSGFDVKALRAFRVLRPLRLVSGVPSKCDT